MKYQFLTKSMMKDEQLSKREIHVIFAQDTAQQIKK